MRCLATAAVAAAAALSVAVPADAARTPVRGVNVHLWTNEYDLTAMEQQLDHAVTLGADTVRVDVGWQNIEPNQKGQYELDWYVPRLDFFMNEAHERGLKVIATLQTTPAWARDTPAGTPSSEWNPPANMADYGDVAAWVATRYGTKLRALEVWNEPNLCQRRDDTENVDEDEDGNFTNDHIDCASEPGSSGTFWRTDRPKSADNFEAVKYAQLVKAAYAAVKAASPSTTVLAGSLAYADASFLNALYAQQLKGHYDGISFHPYNENRPPSDSGNPYHPTYSFLAGIELVRQAQTAAGDTAPQWLTEFGWSTCTDNPNRCVTTAQQAQYLEAAWPLLKNRSYVQAGFVYTLVDRGTTGEEIFHWGVLTKTFGLKPSYAALQRAWTAPNTTITSAPPSPTNYARPTWSFTSSDSGSRFECRIDSGEWTACSSPFTAPTNLSSGSHTFRVRAIDPADNVDATPATQTFTIDLSYPNTTVTSVSHTATSTAATVSFTSDRSDATFECRIIPGNGWQPCTSPKTYTGLADGQHVFNVRAKTPAGNYDLTPAGGSWTVDTTYAAHVRSVGGVRGWWRMNETTGTLLNDASGRGHHGEYGGAFSLGQTGIAAGGTAASFGAAGGDGWIDHHADFALNAFSIEMWVNLSAYGNTAQYRPLFYKGNGVDRNYGLFLAGGTNARLHGSIYTTGGQYVAVDGTTNLALNGWNHVVLTHEANGAMRVYLNGQLQGTSSNTAITPSTSGAHGISLLTAWEPVGAKLDEVVLYDKAMTASQIQQHHARGITP